jgi:hypothetical protein
MVQPWWDEAVEVQLEEAIWGGIVEVKLGRWSSLLSPAQNPVQLFLYDFSLRLKT